jgi:peroxiredoxin Q/BCP
MMSLSRGAAAAFLILTAVGGAARAADTQPPQVGAAAPDFSLKALDGKTVRLSETTARGTTVLVMLRGYPGYQCPFCTTQVGSLLGREADFKKAGAQVLLVYPGEVDRAQQFVRDKKLPAHFTMALDPEFTFTNLYGLRWNAAHETAYPATFVIDAKNRVRWEKISHAHGDRATPDEILKAIAAL